MNVRRQAALLLFATLVIGIALGALGAGALRPRLERDGPPPMGLGPDRRGGPHGPRGSGGFAEHMLETIAPYDADQAAAVRAVVERTAARNRALIEQLNRSLRGSVDSMRGELAPLLRPEQRERLEQTTRRLPPVRTAPGPAERGGPAGAGGPDGGPRQSPPPR